MDADLIRCRLLPFLVTMPTQLQAAFLARSAPERSLLSLLEVPPVLVDRTAGS